jgi:hypothetical protein
MYKTIAEFVDEWTKESAITLKVLQALTDASLKQKSDPAGNTLGKLSWDMAVMLGVTGTAVGLEVAAPARGTEPPNSAKRFLPDLGTLIWRAGVDEVEGRAALIRNHLLRQVNNQGFSASSTYPTSDPPSRSDDHPHARSWTCCAQRVWTFARGIGSDAREAGTQVGLVGSGGSDLPPDPRIELLTDIFASYLTLINKRA